ncbi:hypothetical protein Pla8534_03830 [Lignipirellula cremea]|uniref:Uncharacterized protein n=1 Tax=Lignipirellula cremea TaxID=2528010 RepID=A0A518DLB7_9BACT|nr:hypothetical protein Pla8534_03830 [Lignipirellula cremea]
MRIRPEVKRSVPERQVAVRCDHYDSRKIAANAAAPCPDRSSDFASPTRGLRRKLTEKIVS